MTQQIEEVTSRLAGPQKSRGETPEKRSEGGSPKNLFNFNIFNSLNSQRQNSIWMLIIYAN